MDNYEDVLKKELRLWRKNIGELFSIRTLRLMFPMK